MEERWLTDRSGAIEAGFPNASQRGGRGIPVSCTRCEGGVERNEAREAYS